VLATKLLDVCEGTEFANLSAMSTVDVVVHLSRVLTALETEWWGEGSTFPAPDIIAVETQHNVNADARGVSTALGVLFLRVFPCARLRFYGGSHKLKVCNAMGFLAAPVDGVEDLKRKRAKYADNKARSAAAGACLLGVEAGSVPPDVTDAVCMGVWGLWEAGHAGDEGLSRLPKRPRTQA
jgi:hypothetical protein